MITYVLIVVFVVTAVFMIRARFGDTSSDDAHKLVANGARLLDVRTKSEYQAGHVPGAVNIPVQELESRLAEAGPKDKPVVVYCQAGMRSRRAARILKDAGFTEVHDLGAMSRW